MHSYVLPFWVHDCPSKYSRFNHSDYIRWTVQTMKFLIGEPSPLPILFFLIANNRLRILFSNTLSLHSSLNVRDHVSQPYSTTGNIIVLVTCSVAQKPLKWGLLYPIQFWLVGMLLVSKFGLVEENAVEVSVLMIFTCPLLSWCTISRILPLALGRERIFIPGFISYSPTLAV